MNEERVRQGLATTDPRGWRRHCWPVARLTLTGPVMDPRAERTSAMFAGPLPAVTATGRRLDAGIRQSSIGRHDIRHPIGSLRWACLAVLISALADYFEHEKVLRLYGGTALRALDLVPAPRAWT